MRKCHLFYFGDQQYQQERLSVYLVWAQNKDESKKPHILPIVAPTGDIHEKVYVAKHPENRSKLTFSLETYIKACAKNVVTDYNSSINHPQCWKEDEYDFTAVKVCLGPLTDCIQHRGVDVQFFNSCPFWGFHDMLAFLYMEEGTIPVTWDQIRAASKEVEKPLREDIKSPKRLKPPKKSNPDNNSKKKE